MVGQEEVLETVALFDRIIHLQRWRQRRFPKSVHNPGPWNHQLLAANWVPFLPAVEPGFGGGFLYQVTAKHPRGVHSRRIW